MLLRFRLFGVVCFVLFPHYPSKRTFTATGLFRTTSAGGELSGTGAHCSLHSVLVQSPTCNLPMRRARAQPCFPENRLKRRRFLQVWLPHSTPAAGLSPPPGLMPWYFCLHFPAVFLAFRPLLSALVLRMLLGTAREKTARQHPPSCIKIQKH